jgi:alternative ribosome-rescue factor|tara:strand:- start:73573 stop:73773 length:201 start_codon:yes stop_codon:yes gene_type:complete
MMPSSDHEQAREYVMSKQRKRPNKAKSLAAQPLFRCRQEQPKKGKGSYRREASQSTNWEASVLLAA